MDLNDVKDVPAVDESRMLQQLFECQSQVEKDFGKIEGIPERLLFGKKENLHLPEVCRHINDNIIWRIVQECNEAVVALKNAKTWRSTKYFTDINEYLDEVADIFIYYINLCLASGISPLELSNVVLRKIQVNKERIKSKY